MKKKILIALVVIVVGIQFVPVKRTNPGVVYDFDGPANVKAILKRSCYDCHSNETKWPWYSHVAPVSWFLADHVKEGREHLNFSDWEPLKDVVYMHTQIYTMVATGQMPLKSYLLLHSDAKISPEDLATIKKWAEQ